MSEPLWKLWRNPIIRRFATARLRWLSVLAWGVPLQALAAFIWLTTYHLHHSQQGHSSSDAALRAWIGILVLQGVIWFMKGTFSVATGSAREGIEGLTEMQVLTPLSSWHKTIGYLVGLPIRETVFVLSLLPWSLASIVMADIPIATVVRVHLLLVTAAVLHHALGLVAGTVIRQKIIAGTFSQMIVILLHVIVPLGSSLGLGPLGRLGVTDSIAAELTPLLQKSPVPQADDPLIDSHLRFFHWDVAITGYQWTVMTIVLGVLLVMLWRRWERPSAHLFSKPMAVGFFSWMLLLSLGEILPHLSDSDFFPAENSLRRFSLFRVGHNSQIGLALLWAGGFGVVGLVTLMTLIASIAPTLDYHLRARRGAARSLNGQLPWLDDARSAIPWSLVLVGVLVAAWSYLIRHLLSSSPLFQVVTIQWSAPWMLAVAIAVPLLVWNLLLEWRGAKFAAMIVFIVWILPLMIAIVGIVAGVPADSWPRWLFGASGFALPVFGLLESLRSAETITQDSQAFTLVWRVSILVHFAWILIMFLRLRRDRKLVD